MASVLAERWLKKLLMGICMNFFWFCYILDDLPIKAFKLYSGYCIFDGLIFGGLFKNLQFLINHFMSRLPPLSTTSTVKATWSRTIGKKLDRNSMCIDRKSNLKFFTFSPAIFSSFLVKSALYLYEKFQKIERKMVNLKIIFL